MMTSTTGLLRGSLVLALLLAGCDASVEQETGGGGSGGEAALGGDGEGAGQEGGAPSTGGAPSNGGSNEGGAAEGGAGQGGARSEACALMAQITVKEPALLVAGGDLSWSPGETATFTVTMTNEADEDNFHYPGVDATTDSFDIPPSGNTAFGLFAGDSVPMTLEVTAGADLAVGTEIDLLFTVTTLAEGCRDLDSVGLTVTLE